MADDINQTIFQECYVSYLQDFRLTMKKYFFYVREESYKYFQESAQHLAIVIIFYVIFCFCFYHFLLKTYLDQRVGKINPCKNVVFVISHPDDECMFFGPTIVTLTQKPGANVYILCLSRGKYFSPMYYYNALKIKILTLSRHSLHY